MKKTIILFSLLACMAISAQAQFSQFHVGVAFPSGKFGDGASIDDIEEKGRGCAGTGFTIGYKHYNPLSVENLSWVFGIEAFWNGLNSDAKDDAEDYYGSSADITFPMYLNFPVTLGMNYALPVQESFKLYGEFAIGANFSMPTNYKVSTSKDDISFKFTPLFGFAYGLEAGLFINNKYSIGLRYNNLGSYKYKIETESTINQLDGLKNKMAKAVPITSISLCAGILF